MHSCSKIEIDLQYIWAQLCKWWSNVHNVACRASCCLLTCCMSLKSSKCKPSTNDRWAVYSTKSNCITSVVEYIAFPACLLSSDQNSPIFFLSTGLKETCSSRLASLRNCARCFTHPSLAHTPSSAPLEHCIFQVQLDNGALYMLHINSTNWECLREAELGG